MIWGEEDEDSQPQHTSQMSQTEPKCHQRWGPAAAPSQPCEGNIPDVQSWCPGPSCQTPAGLLLLQQEEKPQRRQLMARTWGRTGTPVGLAGDSHSVDKSFGVWLKKITESSRLEKISKIIKPSFWLISPIPLQHMVELLWALNTSWWALNTSWFCDSTASLGGEASPPSECRKSQGWVGLFLLELQFLSLVLPHV